jgi:rSAM/selenodomain-associated transferase 1
MTEPYSPPAATGQDRTETPAACAIAVMAKASAAGRTKTRLSPPLSLEEAAALNTTFLQDIVANIERAGTTTPIAPYMAYAPEGSEAFFREHLPAGVGLMACCRDNFGACLVLAIDTLLARGHAAACVLNSDSPTLPAAVLVELAEALAAPGDRVVLGPADDGGYYVLGLKTLHPRLFEDIAWSTERVFDQTLARAAEIGLPVHRLPVWYDVDDAEGLARLIRDIFAPPAEPGDPLAPSPALNTRTRLVAMSAQADLRSRLGLNDIEVG